jgi:hypothetical protein
MAKHKETRLCLKSANSAVNNLTSEPLLEYTEALQVNRAGLVNKHRWKDQRSRGTKDAPTRILGEWDVGRGCDAGC